jgi:hypothetical protein
MRRRISRVLGMGSAVGLLELGGGGFEAGDELVAQRLFPAIRSSSSVFRVER